MGRVLRVLSAYILYTDYLYVLIYLTVPGLSCRKQDFQLQHVGCSSLTRDGTWAPCIGSLEFQTLDHQGSPRVKFSDENIYHYHLSQLINRRLQLSKYIPVDHCANYLYHMQMYSIDYYGNTEKCIIEKGKFFIIFSYSHIFPKVHFFN